MLIKKNKLIVIRLVFDIGGSISSLENIRICKSKKKVWKPMPLVTSGLQPYYQ